MSHDLQLIKESMQAEQRAFAGHAAHSITDIGVQWL